MNAVLPVIRAMKEDRERSNVLLTTGTVTSAALAEQISPGLLLHQYVPLDAPSYVRSFLDHWRPDLAILTESEIWPNLVLETYARGVPLVLANARMSGDSFRRWRGKPSMAQPLFSRFDLVLAQNEKLGQRFAQLGARRVEAVGNLKLDSPALPVDVAQRNELALRLAGRPVWLAASTHPGEDEPVLDAHAQLSREMPGLMTILVPRHADRGAEIASKVSQRDLTFARRSQGQMPERGTEVYVGDTMGELGLFYSLSRVAFIGGSLVPKGGQNPVEAVKLSSGVLMGTHWENFRDVYRALLRRQAAREIRSSSELANTVGQLLNDGDQLAQMVQRAGMVVAGMTGALQRTMAALDRYLPSDPPELRHAG
jgi:3-deoxy-D-manno-octulosonic-acid transferase